MMILPELEKPSRLHYFFFAVIVVAMLGMAVAMGVQSKRLVFLEQSLSVPPDESHIDALQMYQMDLSEQLAMVAQNLADTQADTSMELRELAHSVDARLAGFQSQLDDAPPDLSAIHEQLKALDERIDHLSDRLSKITRQAAPVTRHSPAKSSQNNPLPEPAFMLLGAEMRGNERLLSLVPKANPALSHAQLVRVGETVDGWRLQSLDGRHATFEHNGQVRKLSLPEGNL